jgi:peptidylprolyl isomerase
MPAAAVAELPLSHVFSGVAFSGPIIRNDGGRVWTDVFGYHQPASTPELILGPQAIVGTRVRIDQYYPALRSPGDYRLVWQPYGGHVESNELLLHIAALKRAVVTTDAGDLTIDFDYGRAPNHVANFIELARQGFYNQKTFHRIEPGYYAQGGCPNGDGTGIRLDGKKLKAEFNDHPFGRGTVCMARLESDPDSASCQFIICNTRLPEWDGRYTAFGEVVGDDSFQALDKMMASPVDPANGKPQRPIVIRMVRIVDAPEQVTPMGPVPNSPATPPTPVPMTSRPPQEIRPMRPTE